MDIKNSLNNEISIPENTILIGKNIKLPYKYILWCHEVTNKNWNLESYNKICEIDNVSSFWRLFNNFEKLGLYNMHFFFMKDDTLPMWEHENNRNGGVCSFKISIDNAMDLWIDLNMRMICSCLSNNNDDINGISISPRNNWAIVKIWNKNFNNDLSKTLTQDILLKYGHLSIKYKKNIPEF